MCVLDGHGESITPNASVKTIGLENNKQAAAAINQMKYHSTYCTLYYYTLRRRENRIKTHIRIHKCSNRITNLCCGKRQMKWRETREITSHHNKSIYGKVIAHRKQRKSNELIIILEERKKQQQQQHMQAAWKYGDSFGSRSFFSYNVNRKTLHPKNQWTR